MLRIAALLAFLLRNAPVRPVPLRIRHRHLTLAATLNLPSSVVLGGGGGIAMIAGVSRLHSVPGFVAGVVLAVARVPLAVLPFGEAILGG